MRRHSTMGDQISEIGTETGIAKAVEKQRLRNKQKQALITSQQATKAKAAANKEKK